MSVPRFNLHNHTRRSDGAADAPALVAAAIEAGLSHFAVTDHFSTTKLPPGKSVPLDGVAAYAAELRGLHSRHKGRVCLLAGIEVSFSLLQTDFTFLSRVEPDRNPLNSLDFVLFEYVNDAEWAGLGLEELLKLRPLLQVPVGLAHNDLARNFGGILQPESLARILAQAHVFVELCPTRRNSRLQRDAPHVPYYRAPEEFNRRFWQAARGEGVLVSIGCDVHADLKDVGAVDDAVAFLEEQQLEGNAIVSHYWDGLR